MQSNRAHTGPQQHKAMSLLSQWQDHNTWPHVSDRVTGPLLPWAEKYSERQGGISQEASVLNCKPSTNNSSQTAYLCLALQRQRELVPPFNFKTTWPTNEAESMKTKPQIHLPFLNKVSDVPKDNSRCLPNSAYPKSSMQNSANNLRCSTHPFRKEKASWATDRLQNNGYAPD